MRATSLACCALLLGAALTAGQLRGLLRREWPAVAGRSFRVSGVAVSLWPSTQWFRLDDGDAPGLCILFGQAGPMLAGVRQVPGLRRLMPRPQRVAYGRMGTYRVRVEERFEWHRGRARGVLVLVDPETPFRWRPGERIPAFFTYGPLNPPPSAPHLG